ncbi:hypothetical protein [Streptomyces mirabilis]|uniref:hypothetical protein n=1 Tax=Streptomyces mirabilis TaxID=68239 RepID=UPI0033AB8C43
MSAYADQRVLVVGGASGVGLASAREVVTQGAEPSSPRAARSGSTRPSRCSAGSPRPAAGR